jgi:hypothetical protein
MSKRCTLIEMRVAPQRPRQVRLVANEPPMIDADPSVRLGLGADIA